MGDFSVLRASSGSDEINVRDPGECVLGSVRYGVNLSVFLYGVVVGQKLRIIHTLSVREVRCD